MTLDEAKGPQRRTRFALLPRRVRTLREYQNGNPFIDTTGQIAWLKKVHEVKNIWDGWLCFDHDNRESIGETRHR